MATSHAWATHELVDWVVLLLTTAMATVLLYAVPTYCRPFQWTDPSISYPSLPDTFPTYSLALMLLAALLFYVVFVLYLEPHLRQRRHRRWRAHLSLDADDRASDFASSSSSWPRHGPLYAWLKAQLWASGLQYALVSVMKVFTGRLRPDFLDRLARAGITADTTRGHNPQTDAAYFCKLTRRSTGLINGRLSYPSGHAAASFSVCTMVALFLLAHVRPLARQGSFARLLLTLSPLTVAFVCALTRTRDYKHNYSDITTGSLLGIMSALFAFAVCFREVHGGLNIYRARCGDDAAVQQQQQPASPYGDYAAVATATTAAAVTTTTTGAPAGRGSATMDESTIRTPHGYGSVSMTTTTAGSRGDADTMQTAASRSSHTSPPATATMMPLMRPSSYAASPLCDLDRDPAVVPWV